MPVNSLSADQLTIAAARQVASTWLAEYDQLKQPASMGRAAQLTTGEALQAAVINSYVNNYLPISQPGDQLFFVPVQAGYPRWFVQTARFPGKLFSTYVMTVFVQAAQKQPWKVAVLDISPGSDPFQPMTKVARDSKGYATAIPVGDSALSIAPAKLPATWASLYNRGIAVANDSQLIQPNEIDGYRDLQDIEETNGPRHGFADSASQAPGNMPVYALALADGGALVIFSTVNTVHYVATRTATITLIINPASGVPYPPWKFEHDITVPAGTRMSQVTTLQLVAIDPMRADGHVAVISTNQVQTAFSPATVYAATHGQ